MHQCQIQTRSRVEEKTNGPQEGELVMSHSRKERFPRGTYSKLNYKKIGPCKILQNIFDNAYKLELPTNFDISSIFNVANLYEFHDGMENDEEGILHEWKKQLPIKLVNQIE